MQAPFTLNGNEVAAGKRQTIDIDIGRLYTHNEITMPVHIIHGKEAGNVLLVSAAIHGDEIAGVEIIRRLLKSPSLKRIKGTLVAIPIVNVHGFINMSRYLPDRRDLNRSFPGSKKGSLAGRMANLFMEEIMSKVTHGVDLHTGAIHRTNFPQIRANLDDPTTLSLAEAFGTPVLLNSEIREGSLRQAAANIGIPILVYEAGEALRFDEMSIRTGLKGILNIMYQLDMLTPSAKRKPRKKIEPFIARSSSWVRAPESGIVRLKVKPGQRVKKGDILGIITDPIGGQDTTITSPFSGIIIGNHNLPLANEGEALFHIASFENLSGVESQLEELHEQHEIDH